MKPESKSILESRVKILEKILKETKEHIDGNPCAKPTVFLLFWIDSNPNLDGLPVRIVPYNMESGSLTELGAKEMMHEIGRRALPANIQTYKKNGEPRLKGDDGE